MYNFDPNSLPDARALSPASGAVPATLDRGIDFRSVMDTVWRRRLFVGKAVVATVLLAVLFVVLVPRTYTSAALLTIDPRGLQVIEKEVTPRGGQTPDVNVAVVETQTRVLISDSVLRRVVEKERLHEDVNFSGASDSALEAIKSIARYLLSRSHSSDPAVRALTTLQDSVRAWAAKNSYVINLSVTTKDARLSARLAQSVIESFQEVQLANHKDAARRSSESLLARLQELKDRVGRAEAEVQRFKAQGNIVGANGQLVHEQQLTELSNQLAAARMRTTDLRARYELTQRLVKSGAILDNSADALKSPVIAQLRARYAEVKQQEDDFAANLGTRHPLLQSLRSQTASLRQQITAELTRIAQVTRTDYEQAVASDRDLEQRLGARVSEAASLNQAIVQMRELEREAQASRAVYESFLNRAREMLEQQEIDTTNTVVISPAIPPQKPNGIPPILLVFVAAFVGFNVGGLAAVARDRFGGAEIQVPIAKAKTPRGIKSHAGLPVLAILPQPSIESFGGHRQGGSDSPFVADFPPEAKAVGASKAIYELYDRLRAAGPRSSPHVLLVTALDEEIGKSCVALGIALASTCRGEKVLLVDSDPKAVLSHAVGRPSALGFEDVLTLHVPLTAAILKLPPANVAMLTNKTSDKARPVLTRSTVHEMLIAPSSQYDLIVIDGGIATANPSSPALAGAATNAIFVTKEKSARGNAMDKLRSALGPDAEKIVGAVVMVAK